MTDPITMPALWTAEKRRIPQIGLSGTLWQMTRAGSNVHSYFTHPVWLPDGSGLVFASDRTGRTEAFLVEWPSGSMHQITAEGTGTPVVSLDGRCILYFRNRVLIEQDISTGDRRDVAAQPDQAEGVGLVGQTADGMNIAFACHSGHSSFFSKVHRCGGTVRIFHRDHRWLEHLNPSPSDPGLLSFAWTIPGQGESSQRLWLVGIDGKQVRPIYPQAPSELVTHEAWSADGKWIAFTSGPFDRTPGSFSLKRVDPYSGIHETIAKGGNFWHCAPNDDCSMIVADTNWPDEGIKLVDAERQSSETLCLSRCRTAHAHPCFSPDGRKVVFTSDMTGRNQIYVAELP